MESPRGIVISPGFKSTGPDSFSVNTVGIDGILRHCLLYWDRIEWPQNNLFAIGGSPDAAVLESAGILQRHRINFSGQFSGDFTPLIAQGQLKVFEILEKEQPGAWSLAQSSDVLRFPGQTIADHRAIEVQLDEALPVPADGVSFQDILEFKQRHSAELMALRSALDSMYSEILTADDPARVRMTVQERLSSALIDVERALQGRNVSNWRTSASIEIKTPDIAKHAAEGAIVAGLLGQPIALGAFAGAVASVVKLQIARVPMPDSAKNGPFAYLYHAKREMRG